ncbi:hypothetical protein QQ045_007576 [Rhodiola kirilowii]
MKVRYFPDSDYMDANVGSMPSLVWKSLMSVKYILKEGLVWDAQESKFFWNKCSSGLYSTRSGYEVAKSMQRANHQILERLRSSGIGYGGFMCPTRLNFYCRDYIITLGRWHRTSHPRKLVWK